MDAHTLIKIINRLEAKRHRQAEALSLTETELANYEAMLQALKKGK